MTKTTAERLLTRTMRHTTKPHMVAAIESNPNGSFGIDMAINVSISEAEAIALDLLRLINDAATTKPNGCACCAARGPRTAAAIKALEDGGLLSRPSQTH